jgi:hypothetical protein
MEAVNEVTILGCCYFTLLFSEIVNDPMTRYSIGWGMIGFCSMNFAINWIILIYSSISGLYTLLKPRIRRCY